jgi:hypothetical protein
LFDGPFRTPQSVLAIHEHVVDVLPRRTPIIHSLWLSPTVLIARVLGPVGAGNHSGCAHNPNPGCGAAITEGLGWGEASVICHDLAKERSVSIHALIALEQIDQALEK